MKGYCQNCKKKVQGVNKKGYWIGTVLVALLTGLFFIPLGILIFCIGMICDCAPWQKNRCPICGLKINKNGG